jgi:hypothetical protein
MNTILNASIVSPAVLGLTFSFFSLLAIWAALSDRHWFQRFVIILLAPLPLLILPNPEQRLSHGLYIDFALQMLFVATITIVGRCVWYAAVDRRWPFGKFSLSDLCLAVVACSLIFGGVTWPSEGPFAYIDWPISICFAATAAISVWGALGRQPTLARWSACVVIVIGIGIMVRSSISPGIGVLSNDWTLCAAIWLQSGAILISLLLFRYRREHHTQDRILATGWIARFTCVAVGLALVVPLCAAYTYLVRPIVIPDASLPHLTLTNNCWLPDGNWTGETVVSSRSPIRAPVNCGPLSRRIAKPLRSPTLLAGWHRVFQSTTPRSQRAMSISPSETWLEQDAFADRLPSRRSRG